MQQEHLNQYLHLLGLKRRKPDMEALSEIIQAHLERVPFENISKLYRKKHLGLRGLPGLELFLNGIEQFHFGGTCYSSNYYLNQLLAALGYQVILCGADMSEPDVHLVSMVTLQDQEYIIDAGYAAPFLMPLPRSLAVDFVIELGPDRYVLRPQDARGYSRLDLYRDGSLKHGYVAKPFPRKIQEFEPVIAASFREKATFMNSLLLARFFPGRSVVIHNLAMIEYSGADLVHRTLADRDELVHGIAMNFGIPPEITRDVLEDLGQMKDAWG